MIKTSTSLQRISLTFYPFNISFLNKFSFFKKKKKSYFLKKLLLTPSIYYCSVVSHLTPMFFFLVCRIACISAPSVYQKLKQLESTRSDSVSAVLLEFDRRFAAYGDEFVFYDYNNPLCLPEDLLPQSFDIVIADPPYLSEECLSKVALTVKHLTKGKILLCTGKWKWICIIYAFIMLQIFEKNSCSMSWSCSPLSYSYRSYYGGACWETYGFEDAQFFTKTQSQSGQWVPLLC